MLNLIKTTKILLLMICLSSVQAQMAGKNVIVSDHGKQPRIAVSDDGGIHIVFGAENSVYYARSSDQGQTFSKPRVIIALKGMHLGWRTGPQIVATQHHMIISVVGHDNNLQVWYSQNKGESWEGPKLVNAVPGALPEGFHSIAAGEENYAFAVWLAVQEKGLNISGSKSRDGGKTWEKNQIIYVSPGGSVCECCHPSVSSVGDKTAVMWRNALAGNRDMHMAISLNGGLSFGNAYKLGKESWQLNGCPVDGGGVSIDSNGEIFCVWRRKNNLYLSDHEQSESLLGEGKQAVIVQSARGPFIAWQHDPNIMVLPPSAEQPLQIGEGAFAALASSGDQELVVLAYQQKAGIVVQTFEIK